MNLRRNRPGTKAADLWNWYILNASQTLICREQEDIANMNGPFAV